MKYLSPSLPRIADDEVRAIHPDMGRLPWRFETAGRHLESSLAGNGALTGDRPEDVAYRDLIVTGQQCVAAAVEARDSTSLS